MPALFWSMSTALPLVAAHLHFYRFIAISDMLRCRCVANVIDNIMLNK